MSSGTLELLGQEIGRALQPLADQLKAGDVRDLLAELGLQFPASLEAQGGFVSAIGAAADAAGRLGPLGADLAAAIEADDVGQMIRTTVQIIDVLRTLIPALDTIGTSLNGLSGSFAGIDPAVIQAFAAELPRNLLDHTVVSYFEAYHPVVLRFLALLGIVELIDLPGDATTPAFTRRKLRFERLADLFNSPENLLRSLYGWGDPGFDGRVMLERIQLLLASLSLPVSYDAGAKPPALRFSVLSVSPRVDLAPPGLEAKVVLDLPAGVAVSVPLFEPHWAIEFELKADLAAQTGVTFQPPATLNLIPPSGTVQGEASFGIARTPKAGNKSIVLLAIPGGSGLQAQRVSLGLTAGFSWTAPAGPAKGDFGIEGMISGGKLIVTLDGADGFIGKILSGFGLEADFDLGFGWRAGSGVYFTGSSVLEIQLPLHISLGPVDLSALTASIGIENRKFPVGLSTNIKAALGPIQAVVEQIGIAIALSFPADGKGQLGPFDFSLEFKPPKGAGLSIDAGVVKGGGYIFLDPDRGEYAGALELTFAGIIAVKAIGIITTKMPDGSKGFSLLIIMSVEFGGGFQLGFGFTLVAVGGLLGLNRTMNLQALMEGVRTNAIASIMFPKDVVANAPKIISDLRAFFPPKEGVFLIGPMAKIGWGTPTLVSVSLGVIIEIPGNIAIVGVLRLALPTEDVALINLQVNFAGAIEFDRKRIYFFAALFDSRIAFLTIEGEMGLLVAFGDDANFVVSVGGFHPRFTPPPLPFPSPRRIEVSLLSTPVSRVRIEGYFAVTSNTAQFGARVEVFFGLDEINVNGFVAFDALFQFSPFYFIIEISASLSVTVFGVGLFSVSVNGSLEGPGRYHIKGHGSISLLFFDIGVDFDTSWGESPDTQLPPIEVLPLLKAEMDKADSWRALPPVTDGLFVSLRRMPEAEAAMILHPVGVLHISQRAVPLQLHLDKVGNQKPSDVNRLAIDVTGGGLERKADATEPFAPAQFQDFSDADKLSRPAYAPEISGLDLSAAGADTRSSRMVRRVVRYEEIIIDSNFKRFRKRFSGFLGVLFNFFLAGSAVTRCELSQFSKSKVQPFDDKITVAPSESYTVAFQSNNQAVAVDAIAFRSEASAREYMNGKIANDDSLADELHVIPSFERAA